MDDSLVMGHPEDPDEAAETALAAVTAAVRDAEDDGRLDLRRVLAALATLRHLRDQLDEWEPFLISAARAGGASWADLAPALGVASRQAAERRYLRLRRSDQDAADATQEVRVEAERDRRAGQRAVTDWARTNGADLRQLAGQVTALTDLGPDAQASLDRLHDALGRTDPAALLPLLSDAHGHLSPRHATLADRITRINERTEEIRDSTRRERIRTRATVDPDKDSK
jgi:hypothetical protein